MARTPKPKNTKAKAAKAVATDTGSQPQKGAAADAAPAPAPKPKAPAVVRTQGGGLMETRPMALTADDDTFNVTVDHGAEYPKTMLTVFGPKRGRWRIGRRFTREGTKIALYDLSEDEITALRGDPTLSFEIDGEKIE